MACMALHGKNLPLAEEALAAIQEVIFRCPRSTDAEKYRELHFVSHFVRFQSLDSFTFGTFSFFLEFPWAWQRLTPHVTHDEVSDGGGGGGMM